MKAEPEIPARPPRKFIPEELTIDSWEILSPYYEMLLEGETSSAEFLRDWFRKRSELEAAVSEDLAWRYVRMTCYTENEDYAKQYHQFIETIQPKIAPFSDKLNRKAAESATLSILEKQSGFDVSIRSLKNDIELFREENIPLFTEINKQQQKFAQISGAMMVEVDGKEMTLPQAGVILMDTNRQRRESVYRKISARRLTDKKALDELFSSLISLRHQVAVNAGFANFRDYMFRAMGRFDYSVKDCLNFHQSIEQEVVPLLNDLAKVRQKSMSVSSLRPWDKIVDEKGRPPLKPFSSGEELLEKTIEVFHRIDPFLGECIDIMKQMGRLDLESRKGKAPGGYNYPMAETGVPFIFMNATSTLRDLVTLMHEGGHAIHNFLTRDLEINDFKSTPSEVAELASMSMELISMDHWDVFFTDEAELKRAKREHLEDIIETLPWVATIDHFQHWLYEHPEHTLEERKKNWNEIFNRYADTVTDWSGLEESKDYLWQKQLHLFEVPFYYIEYGMAQLGAIAMWRNYKKDNKKGLEGYKNALKLGYMKTIPEIYAAGGIRFDFSRDYIRELMEFVRAQLSDLD